MLRLGNRTNFFGRLLHHPLESLVKSGSRFFDLVVLVVLAFAVRCYCHVCGDAYIPLSCHLAIFYELGLVVLAFSIFLGMKGSLDRTQV